MAKNLDNHSFTKALKRLEEIVDLLENPNIDLEEGLKLLEEGVKLHKYCKDKLTQANVKIINILKEEREKGK
ncbi:exodeoxyribonuclease VII small subunit [Candidatus Curtissbacteria bacterium]|nr:exodeoxyribonuclease VII small subunit [Candidatus Curtissbacteria bacterium]